MLQAVRLPRERLSTGGAQICLAVSCLLLQGLRCAALPRLAAVHDESAAPGPLRLAGPDQARMTPTLRP